MPLGRQANCRRSGEIRRWAQKPDHVSPPLLNSSDNSAERSFARVLEPGGMLQTSTCGRKNVHNRYLIHVAGYNLGILMRISGAGTPTTVPNVRFGVPVCDSARRHRRCHDPRRLRCGDGGAVCRRHMRSRPIKVRLFLPALKA